MAGGHKPGYVVVYNWQTNKFMWANIMPQLVSERIGDDPDQWFHAYNIGAGFKSHTVPLQEIPPCEMERPFEEMELLPWIMIITLIIFIVVIMIAFLLFLTFFLIWRMKSPNTGLGEEDGKGFPTTPLSSESPQLVCPIPAPGESEQTLIGEEDEVIQLGMIAEAKEEEKNTDGQCD